MDDLPIDTEAQKIGRDAASVAGPWFNKRERGLLWREGRQDEDFGIDGELELTGRTVSGLLIKVQINGTRDTAPLKSGRLQHVPVRVRTMNYWAAIPLPVVAFLVDVDSEEIYWTQPDPIFDAKSPKLTFTPTSNVDLDPTGFVATLGRLAQTPPASSALDHIHLFMQWWAELREIACQFDSWTPVLAADVDRLQLLAEHVLQLRALLGLAEEPLVPWTMWLARTDYLAARCEMIFNETGLIHATATEMIEYLEPYYIAALERLGEIARRSEAILTHPRIAGLANAGMLDGSYLKIRFAPWEDAPAIEPVLYQVGYPEVLRSDRTQLALDALLRARKASPGT